MTRNQRVQMVRFPNREKEDRRINLFGWLVMGSILTVDVLMTYIGW
jgi:hypothetical protein